MRDRFPLGYDREQHARLRRLYGDLVPPIQFILVRPGLHDIVDKLFSGLGRLPCKRDLRVRRIESRNAGFLEIATTGAAAGAGDVLAGAEDAARTTCEHCGAGARMIVKVGTEAWIARPDIELQDRLLCLDCAHTFQHEIRV